MSVAIEHDQGNIMAKKHKLREQPGTEGGRVSQQQADAQGVREGTLRAAGRADPAAGLGGGRGRAGDRGVRGPRHGRQGRRDQADHRALQPARVPACGAAGTLRPREEPALHPALHGPLSGRGRDHPVRSLLVQPGRRRAGDGLLHRRAIRALPQAGAWRSSASSSTTASSCSNTSSTSARTSSGAGSRRGSRTRSSTGS